jgi:hypothetical protein
LVHTFADRPERPLASGPPTARLATSRSLDDKGHSAAAGRQLLGGLHRKCDELCAVLADGLPAEENEAGELRAETKQVSEPEGPLT